MPLCVSVYMCFVVTCWARADLLALVCGVLLCVCYFSIGILSQVWYLSVLIPDLYTLTYFGYVVGIFAACPLDFDHAAGFLSPCIVCILMQLFHLLHLLMKLEHNDWMHEYGGPTWDGGSVFP